jgi:hypothetical protein
MALLLMLSVVFVCLLFHMQYTYIYTTSSSGVWKNLRSILCYFCYRTKQHYQYKHTSAIGHLIDALPDSLKFFVEHPITELIILL